MKQRLVILIPLVLVIVAFAGYRFFSNKKDKEPDSVRVMKSKFEVSVVTMGELEAFESSNILIPAVLVDRTIHIRHISITDMVREGTLVEKGGYVATLDPSEVEENIKNVQEDLDMLIVQLENARIDSSINLALARDEIRQSQDNVLDKEIKVEQSVYESKAIQRQAKIELEMAHRSFDHKKRNYLQQERKHKTWINRYQDKIKEEEKQMAVLEQLKSDLVVKAPSSGVVVYARDERGNKVKVGSSVGRWSPKIAILPNLSNILSVTYVKEIDVNKIAVGMPVKINIDAFPGHDFDGRVIKVANIGQDIPDQFLNGFKVEIGVDPGKFDLLPGMTAMNRFVVSSMEDQLMIPRPALFLSDSTSFVYKKEGMRVVRQTVTTGGENENYVRITHGLGEGDKVLLHPPE
jgi:multidrug efflux pump subunit AcrA (membrane-fusion protein)